MKTKFKAVFDNGVIIEWHHPQTWRNIFHLFKLAGVREGRGVLFCNETPVRETGIRKENTE